MYCPKCSQSQASDDMRYCSRCGFPLDTVAILLQNDGLLPSRPKGHRSLSQRGRIATESVVLTVFSWLIGLWATLWFDSGGPYEVIAKLGSLIFFVLGFIGLLRFLYAFLFVRPDEERAQESHVKRLRDTKLSALPPAQQTPLSDFPRRINTKEIVRPISVTENTTQLLDESSSHRNLAE